MNEVTSGLDRTEEEALFHEVSDEAMEAAAGKVGQAGPTPTFWTSSCYAACCQRD
jgi:hypothetical protein